MAREERDLDRSFNFALGRHKTETELLADYIRHREPHFSKVDAMAAANHAIQWLKSRQ